MSQYELVRTDREIEEVIDACSDASEEGSRYPAMSYEDGVRYAIEWMTDRDTDVFE